VSSTKDNFNNFEKNKLELEAIDALKMQNYSLAESLYKKLISINADSKEYNNNLANIYLISKQPDLAIKYYNKALMLDHNIHKVENQSIAYNLSCAYQINNDLDNTIKYLALTLEINPEHQSALGKIENLKQILSKNPDTSKNHYNLAVIFHKLKNYKEAEKYYLLDLHNNSSFESNYNLGSIYQKLKDYNNALIYYKAAYAINPDSNTEYLINSIEENSNIIKPPKEYISSLFNYYSDNYENDLINNLTYKVPEYFFDIFKKHLIDKEKKFNLLDLGCGTGLIGQKFKIASHKVSKIIGTDLSERMLNLADDKKVYTDLYNEDISESLNNKKIIESNINLITAADVLVYIGDLDEVFYFMKDNFKNCYFLFSCEDNNSTKDYELKKTGRYQHNKDYLFKILKKYNFNYIFDKQFQLRKNENTPVTGNIFLVKT